MNDVSILDLFLKFLITWYFFLSRCHLYSIKVSTFKFTCMTQCYYFDNGNFMTPCCTCRSSSAADMQMFHDSTTLIARLMGPTWGPSGADRSQVGPRLVPWTLLSGYIWVRSWNCCCLVIWFCYQNQVTRQPQFRDLAHILSQCWETTENVKIHICFLNCIQHGNVWWSPSDISVFLRTMEWILRLLCYK